MRDPRSWIVASWLALVLAAAPSAQLAAAADRFWFCPAPGSIDYLDLFSHPDRWAVARQIISVFKFYQQHTQTPAPDIVGPNTYDALARAGAFRMLGKWKKKIAMEAGSVKDFYCTPDASGMNASIASSVASLRAVASAGGTVSYIAMDEPFVAGREAVCGGPALEPTADRVATYVRGVHAQFPNVQIGLIEAYPFTSEPTLEAIIDLLRARGVPPAFVHADVDTRALRPGRDDFTRDMRALRDACAARNIPFGIIVWGYNGDADALYTQDAAVLAREIGTAFTGWPDMPDHLIAQSWAVSSTGLLITPSNLPESTAYTHTNLVRELWHQFRGQTGPPGDTAVKKVP